MDKKIIPYSNGERMKLIFTGASLKVLNQCACTSDAVHYEVEMDNGNICHIDHTEIAPEEHPIHETVKRWKKEMVQGGFDSIAAGRDANGKLASVYFKGAENYQKILRSRPDVKWLYYWELREEERLG